MIKGVIFDMDGVIMDSEPIHFKVEKAIISNFNEPYTIADHSRFVGQTSRDLWRTLCEERNIDQNFEVLAMLDHADYMQELKTGDLVAIEGIPELIHGLHKQSIPMVVASSANRENIKVVTERLKLKDFFEGSVSGQDVEKTKPNPEIFLKAAEMLGIDPRNCAVIEDAKHGVAAAKAAGMFCIGYKNLNSGNQDLGAADLIVNSIAEIDIAEINEKLSKENNDYVT